MDKAIDSLSSKYGNFFLIGDFNAQARDTSSVKDFCDIYGFEHLINKPTCCKNYINPKCIDVVLTNRHRNFQKFLCY